MVGGPAGYGYLSLKILLRINGVMAENNAEVLVQLNGVKVAVNILMDLLNWRRHERVQGWTSTNYRHFAKAVKIIPLLPMIKQSGLTGQL